MSSITDRAESAGQQASNSEWIDRAARIGLIAYGVVHLMIGWLAVQIAWSASDSKSADTSGALKNAGKSAVWQGPVVAGRGRPGGARALAGQ